MDLPQETITARPEESVAQNWQGVLQLASLSTLILVLYYRILGHLVHQWWTDPNYSHGLLVPIFCAWLLKNRLQRIGQVPVAPSWWGLTVSVGALCILMLGVLGAELFLSRTSLLILLAGLAIQFRGWKFFREILSPWALLFLTIPLPAIIFNQISLPLQFQASRLASGLLALLAVPVLREGNVIQLPSITLDVMDACSGLRSLMSLITLAVFYGCIFERRVWARALLVVIAVPIAVVANAVRIVGSGLLGQYWDPSKAEGFFHLYSGLIIFVISLGSVIAVHSLLSRFDRRLQTRNP